MSHREARDDGAYSFVYEPSRGEQAMQAFIFTILDYFIFPWWYFKSVLCTIVILCFSGARLIGNRMYIIWSSKFRLLKSQAVQVIIMSLVMILFLCVSMVYISLHVLWFLVVLSLMNDDILDQDSHQWMVRHDIEIAVADHMQCFLPEMKKCQTRPGYDRRS